MSPNKFGEERCSECGTPLMLVVETPMARFDASFSQLRGQEHLIERISWLEQRLLQLIGRTETILNLMMQQGNNTFFHHTLLDALVTILANDDVINVKELNEQWQANRDKKPEKKQNLVQMEALKEDWLAGHEGRDKQAFARYIEEATDYFSKGEWNKAVKYLETAAALSPKNTSLNLFIALSHFREKRTALARDYFYKVFINDGGNTRLAVMLALSHCEEGEVDSAKRILQKVTRKKDSIFAAHYALGRLLIIEEKWSEALLQFKKALSLSSSAEAHFVIANAYYQLGRLQVAEKHARSAIEADNNFAEALYLLGLILLRKNEIELAKTCFKKAEALDNENSRFSSAVKNTRKLLQKETQPPLFASLKLAKKKLVTCGDPRIAEFVWKNALGE